MTSADFTNYTVVTITTPNGKTQTFQFKPGTPEANMIALQTNALNALAGNLTFLGLTPTFPLSNAAQQALVQQVAALTRQVDALIRLALGQLTTITDS